MAGESTHKQRRPSARGGARSGGAHKQGARAEAGRPSAVDFSQPTRFKPQLRQRISAALQDACEALSARLGEELHAEITLSLQGLAEHTWASARARLPADSLAVALEQEDGSPALLLSLELPLLLAALELLLGGELASAPASRPLGEVDRALAGGLLDLLTGELAPAWRRLGGAGLLRGEIDLEGDAGLSNAPGEATLLATFELALEDRAHQLSLLIPFRSTRALADAREAAQSPAQGAELLRHGLAGANVLVRAEVGSLQMPAERMLELRPGEVLELEQRAELGVLLFARGVSLGRGRPGRSGSRRAVKLESIDEPPVRAATYATLARAELTRARAEQAQGASGAGLLRSLYVRIWAELGCAHLPLGHTLELREGAVVELDQDADAPLELFANGLHFASGRLLVTGEGHWGIELLELL